MATGSLTYKGLAVPLSGESEIKQLNLATDILTITGASSQSGDFFVLRDVDKSEVWAIDYRGVTDLTVTTEATAFVFDVRATMSSASGWNLVGNFALDLNVSGASGGQNYALRAAVDGAGTPQMGGKNACLYCYFLSPSCTVAENASFIHFSDGATQLQYFFTIDNCAVDQSCFVANAASAATNGLRIMHGTTTYYIMCTTCTG